MCPRGPSTPNVAGHGHEAAALQAAAPDPEPEAARPPSRPRQAGGGAPAAAATSGERRAASSSTELRPSGDRCSPGSGAHRAPGGRSAPRGGGPARRAPGRPVRGSSRRSPPRWSARSSFRCRVDRAATRSPPRRARGRVVAQRPGGAGRRTPTPRPTSWRRRSTTGCRAARALHPGVLPAVAGRVPPGDRRRPGLPSRVEAVAGQGREPRRCTSRCSAPCSPAQLLIIFLPAVISLGGGRLPGAQGRGARPPRRGRVRRRRHRRRRGRRRTSVDGRRGARPTRLTRTTSRRRGRRGRRAAEDAATTSTSDASAASGRARRGSAPSRRSARDPVGADGEVGDLLGQPPQGEGHGVGLRLGHVDAVAAEPGADLRPAGGRGSGRRWRRRGGTRGRPGRSR